MSIIELFFDRLRPWLSPRRAGLILAAVGCLTVAAALGFEHIGGYQPCELCLKERLIYYASVPAGLAAWLLALRRPALAIALIALCGLGFLANTALAAYHAGAEWGLWAAPGACSSSAPLAQNVNALLESLKAERPVPCDVAQFRLLGISFAGYDALLSLAMAAFTLLSAAVSIRPRHTIASQPEIPATHGAQTR